TAEDVRYFTSQDEADAAERLGVECARCLVFEDSLAGLQAARSAGMRTIAIGPSTEKQPLSDHMVVDFHHLPDDFFESLGVA
ncbi:MAG: HAD-IA family hydrolase, partial [Myxococcota bacterium]